MNVLLFIFICNWELENTFIVNFYHSLLSLLHFFYWIPFMCLFYISSKNNKPYNRLWISSLIWHISRSLNKVYFIQFITLIIQYHFIIWHHIYKWVGRTITKIEDNFFFEFYNILLFFIIASWNILIVEKIKIGEDRFKLGSLKH